MTTQYEINDADYRHLTDTDILYNLLGNRTMAENIAGELNTVYPAFINRSDLVKVPGIGDKSADIILSAIELGRRITLRDNPVKDTIMCSLDIYNLMKADMWNLTNEEFWIVITNTANRVLKKMRISIGCTDSCMADVKIILNEVIKVKGRGLILVHNHPSGRVLPSRNDDQMTTQIKNACLIIGTNLIDHIIISGDKYYSYADECHIL